MRARDNAIKRDTDLHNKDDFISWDDLKTTLQSEVNNWQLDHQTTQQVKTGILPKLSVLAGARIMNAHLYFCVFSTSESERLALYLPTDGIYTQNMRYIKRVIDAMYPAFNEKQAEDVIYHLTNWAEVKSPTVDRYLIPVANGIYNLHKHKLMPFSPDYVFTTKIATKYVDNPIPPTINGWTFDGWLNELACGDDEIVRLLWQVINDSLNGNYTRKKAIFLYSEQGSSGKGTFQRLLQYLVGIDNVGALKVNQFEQPFKLSILVGKTICIGDDISPDIYIKDSGNFNSVTTGDLVAIEFKNKDTYTTTLRCTIIQSCNGLPTFKNKGGTMRRVLIVPFNNHFTGSGDNWKIKDDYLARRDVLEYVLYKALQLDFEKFDIPTASKEALKQFEMDTDPLVGFKTSFFDNYEIDRIPTYYLYAFYKRYCKNNNFSPLGQAKFTRRFLAMLDGYETKSTKMTHDNIHQLKQISDNDELCIYESLPELNKAYRSLFKSNLHKKA